METTTKGSMCENGTCSAVCSCRWFSTKMVISVAMGILLAAAVMGIIGAGLRLAMGKKYGDDMHSKRMQMMQNDMMQGGMMEDDMMSDEMFMETMPEGEELPVGQDGAVY